jgi:hypothetical protein
MTSIEWFVDQLPVRIVNQYMQEIDKAKQMHKKEILNAHKHGFSEGVPLGASPLDCRYKTSEEYYQETFKK